MCEESESRLEMKININNEKVKDRKSKNDSSNTDTGVMTGFKKGQNFILTINEKALEHYDKILKYLKSLTGCKYILVTEHIGQENKHYHIYVQYDNVKKLSFSKLFGAHLEKCFGSAQKCREYLLCEDDKHKKEGITAIIIHEEGEAKLRGGCRYVKDILNMDKDEIGEVPLQYANTAKKIMEEEHEKQEFFKMLREIKNNELKGPKIIYLYGESGNGKTYGAYKMAMNDYEIEDIGMIEINNNFCKITNDDAKCFIIPEFRPSQMHASDFLQLIDKYGYNCNVKGGFKFLRPEMIIICSIISPYNIYNDEKNKQFLRRITKLYKIEDNHNMIEKEIKFEE